MLECSLAASNRLAPCLTSAWKMRAECIAIGPDSVECRLKVAESLCNNYGTLHGGATSTLVDVVGTLALLGKDPTRPGVSVEMNQSFCSAAKLEDELTIEGRVLRYGKKIGFTEVHVRLFDAENPTAAGRLIATGRHTEVPRPSAEESHKWMSHADLWRCWNPSQH